MAARSASPALAGCSVVVTRPRAQAEDLCRLIEAEGGRAIPVPLLDIVPTEPDAAIQADLARGAAWDWLIFVSVNAVRHGCGWWLPSAGTGRSRVAAIGEATAQALRSEGLPVDLTPKPQSNSEALLAMPEFTAVAGRRILIVRGVGGRELLAEELRRRGAFVEYAEVYRRQPSADAERIRVLWQQGHIDVLVLTSGEALVQLLAVLDGSAREFAAAIPMVTLGGRLAGLARSQGWTRVEAAAETSDRGLVQALIRLHAGSTSPPTPSIVADSAPSVHETDSRVRK